jgi:hypothetical protein
MKLNGLNIVLAAGVVMTITSCVKTKGDVTMTYTKADAIYGNIDDLRSTSLIGTPQNIVDPGKIYIGETFLLIGEEGKGIHIFDNTNPSAPIYSSFINIPFTKEFFVEKDIIYAESQYDMLKIDISDIHNPTLVHRLEYAFTDAITNDAGEVLLGFEYDIVTEEIEINSNKEVALRNSSYLYYDYHDNLIPVSSVPSSFAGSSEDVKGTLNKIALQNGYVYALGNTKLHKFEDTPSTLIDKGDQFVSQDMETIYAEGDNLFIGTRSSMVIMDASNPENPNWVSEFSHETSCDPVYPQGDVAYLTLRSNGNEGCGGVDNTLTVFDISDLANPQPLNVIPMSSPYGMAMIDNKLYVGEGANGVTIFDATDKENLVQLSTDAAVQVFDIMEHPTMPNMIVTTGANGLNQYEWDATTQSLNFLSSINY